MSLQHQDEPPAPPLPDSSPARWLRERTALIASLGFLLFVAALQFSWIAGPYERLHWQVTVDDTYLYLQIARNWVSLGFPTFDGVTPTNGFQPLWGSFLYLLAALVRDPIMLVRATCGLAVVLNITTLALLLLLGRRRELLGGPLALAGSVLFGATLCHPEMLSGMDNGIHGLVFLGVLFGAIALWREENGYWRPGAWLAFSFILALNGLCRLDSGLISLAVAAVFALRLAIRRQFAAILCLGAPAALILAGYLAVNQAYFGISTPISGRAKIFWAQTGSALTPEQRLIEGSEEAWEALVFNIRNAAGSPGSQEVVVPILCLVMLVGFAFAYRRGTLHPAFVLLFVLTLGHVLLMNLLLVQFGDADWYYQPLRIMLALGLAHVVFLVNWDRPGVVHRLVAAILMAVVAVGAALEGIDQRLDDPDKDHRDLRRLDAARWISTTDELPADAIIGSWNAGQLGYLGAPRRVVNLDGLVQDEAFLNEVIMPGAWREYFRTRGIRYLADYNDNDSTQTFRREWENDEYFRGVVPYDRVKVVRTFGTIEIIDLQEWLEGEE